MDGIGKLKTSMQKPILREEFLSSFIHFFHIRMHQSHPSGGETDRQAVREEVRKPVSLTPEVPSTAPNRIFTGKNVQQNLLKDPQRSISTLG